MFKCRNIGTNARMLKGDTVPVLLRLCSSISLYPLSEAAPLGAVLLQPLRVPDRPRRSRSTVMKHSSSVVGSPLVIVHRQESLWSLELFPPIESFLKTLRSACSQTISNVFKTL